MEGHEGAGEPNSGGSTLDRRRFLAKATVVGGTVWAVPLLVSAGPAHAASLKSPPPTTTSTTKPTESTPTTADQGPKQEEKPPTGTGPETAGPGTLAPTGYLAETGANIDQLARLGVVTVAGGAALKVWSARQAAATTPVPAPVEAPPTD